MPSRADDIPPLRALLDLAATGDIGPGSAATRDGSARIDLDYVVTTILDGVERARAPAAAPSGC